MEIDADRCEYRLAGSRAFESAIRRLNVPARQVTLLHYTEDQDLPVVPAALVRTTP